MHGGTVVTAKDATQLAEVKDEVGVLSDVPDVSRLAGAPCMWPPSWDVGMRSKLAAQGLKARRFPYKVLLQNGANAQSRTKKGQLAVELCSEPRR